MRKDDLNELRVSYKAGVEEWADTIRAGCPTLSRFLRMSEFARANALRTVNYGI